MLQDINRRPIAMRTTWWAESSASALVRAGLKPNQISLLSIGFSILGSMMFLMSASPSPVTKIIAFISAAICIQLRLFCNMIDGLMAVEGGLQSKLGALFNEIPDRVADILFLVYAGYAAQSGALGIVLGWGAATFAVMTAYIRAFGGAQGIKQDFCGPMAKQQRMAVLTIASLFAAIEVLFAHAPIAITLGLGIIVIGALFTCLRRIRRLAKALENGAL